MSLLQAVRYYILTRDLEKAKSFGLNRAVFYAWAKYHGKYRIQERKPISIRKSIKTVAKEGKKLVYVGNERVFISECGWS